VPEQISPGEFCLSNLSENVRSAFKAMIVQTSILQVIHSPISFFSRGWLHALKMNVSEQMMSNDCI
jgi:hypothetical protein